MNKFIAYDDRLHKVQDEDDEYFLIDAHWHPSDSQQPVLVPKFGFCYKRNPDTGRLEPGETVTCDHVTQPGINWYSEYYAHEADMLKEVKRMEERGQRHHAGFNEVLECYEIHAHY